MKKNSFVLVEFLVAFTLFSVVVAGLFAIYSSISKVRNSYARIEKKMDEERLVYIKLHSHFSMLEDVGRNETDIFYTATDQSPRESGQSLIFISRNGGDIDRGYTSSAYHKLYIDGRENTLVMATFPNPKVAKTDNEAMRMRIRPLLSRVESVRYSFWLAPSIKDEISPSCKFPQDKLGTWQESWEKEYGILPTLMKMEIRRENDPKPIVFHFIVSDNIGAINYT